jgi:DUF1680 family protein
MVEGPPMDRIPGWASRATVAVNGETAGVEARPGEYCEIGRAWSAGNTELQPWIDSQLLGERVAVPEGQAERIPQSEWSGQLYRDLQDPERTKIDIRLVPYYA